MRICIEEKCTGCNVCMNVCPNNAICIEENELGKTVARIDENKCTKCSACTKTCPVNNQKNYNSPQKCYAAWSKNQEYQVKSASGGISAGFANYIVKNNGVVFGTCFLNGNLIFDSAKDAEEITKFQGSKYVQANTGLIYNEVKKQLIAEKKVMFVGTPCQVAALNAYLNKEYKNLLTVDFVCHGVPPMKYLKQHIENITKKNIDEVTFRGEKDFFLTLYGDGTEIYSKKSQLDSYYTAFLEGIIHRDNCYECEYACKERVSDITIGDFWGLDKKDANISYNGRISVVLLNTQKGIEFFEDVGSNFEFVQRPLEEALNGNGQLNYPSTRHKDREFFENTYKKKGFNRAVQTKSVIKIRKKYKSKQRLLFLKKMLKKTLMGVQK